MSTETMPRPGLLTHEQCGRLGSQTQVRIVQPLESITHPGEYWRERSEGYTTNASEAGIYTAVQAISFGTINQLFELVHPLPPTTPAPPPDPSKPVPIRLTYKQVMQNMAGIEAKMCRMVYCGLYLKDPYGSGYQPQAENALVKNIKNSLEIGCSAFLYELLDQDEALRISQIPVKLCLISEALSPALIDSLKLHPNHPVYRALVLSALGKMPPPELTTFEEVANWIEFNCEPRTRHNPEVARANPAPPAGPRLEIPLSFSDRESGTCRYSVDRFGSGTFTFTAEELADIIEGEDDIDNVIEAIESYINDNAYEVQGDMEWSDEGPDYDRHDTDSSDSSEWSYDEGTARRRENIINFMRNNLSQEQLEQLGIAP